jgi:hypothetical protein
LHSSDTEEKWEYNETVHQIIIDFKKDFYNILIEFGASMNKVRIIKMCLNDTYGAGIA